MLQSADASKSMRDHQLALAGSEGDADDSPVPIPRLWSSISPHGSFPYPSSTPVIEACWQHLEHGIPEALRPPMPHASSAYAFGGQYAYVQVKEACRVP